MSTESHSSRFPWIAVVIAVVLALAGVCLLAFAIISLRGGAPTAAPTAVSHEVVSPMPSTAVALNPEATSAVVIPTITEAPSQPTTAEAATAAPGAVVTDTETAAPPTAVPATTVPTLTILQSANVRTGPGLVYSIIGGLTGGSTAPVVGRDAGAQWFVISFGSGQGWVSGLLSKYDGDVNSLPVIAAPPTPVPTSTPVPTATPIPLPTPVPQPTNPPAPVGYTSRGLIGNSFSIENTTAAVNQAVWFNFSVTNPTNGGVSYAVLAAHTDSGPNAQSWTNATLKPNSTLNWRDHIFFGSTGTYQVYLGICYQSKDACLSNSAPWDRLSASVTVTIQ
jgi:uncharacterized protein YraI